MRTYLIFSKEACGCSLATKLEREGNRAVVYINDVDKRSVGEGIVEKAKLKDQIIGDNGSLDLYSLSSLLSQTNPDCVVFDGVDKGFGKVADIIHKDKPAIGACLWGEVCGTDPLYNKKIMRMVGISTVDDAEENELGDFINGVEITSEVWFNGNDVLNVNYTMEERSLMEGGIGPEVIGMGSVVWNGNKKSKLFVDGVGKFIDTLHKLSYKGPINLKAIIVKDKLFGVEFSTGFKYNNFFVLNELMNDKLGDVLYGFATGVVNRMSMREGYGMGVNFAVLPFPLPLTNHKELRHEICRDKVIQGIDDFNLKHMWMGDMYKKEDQYLCSGVSGMLGTITTRSDVPGDRNYSQGQNPVREVQRRCYRTLSNINVSGMMYRRDIGERLARDRAQLESWGWL